jgi:hypothetical protein
MTWSDFMRRVHEGPGLPIEVLGRRGEVGVESPSTSAAAQGARGAPGALVLRPLAPHRRGAVRESDVHHAQGLPPVRAAGPAAPPGVDRSDHHEGGAQTVVEVLEPSR